MTTRQRKKINKRQLIKRIQCINVSKDSVLFISIDSSKCKPDVAQEIANILKNYTEKNNIKAFVIPDCVKNIRVRNFD